MTTSMVWVKLRGSTADAFKVKVDEGADLDDLKKAIKAEKTVEVEFIYSADREDSRCDPRASIFSDGIDGADPYYYTIESPAIQPPPGKH